MNLCEVTFTPVNNISKITILKYQQHSNDFLASYGSYDEQGKASRVQCLVRRSVKSRSLEAVGLKTVSDLE